ncbi:TadE/TadG family type IV pilus assembly protein [Brevundimonas sp. S1H14]|uniref:TadE/TadG family type IV pilus assembly protein n=1 Tax=Brevundimonas sp. S1H14 TaxID=3078084 RepID=UPI0039ED3D00
MSRRLRLRSLTRLLRNRDGATAIEFALIAPVMILLYFGLVEFSQGFMAQRRASHAASVVSDLVAQSERTNRAGINAIYAVGGLIMRPFPAAELSIRTTSISVDARGVATIEWSHGNGKALSPLQRGSRVTDLPPDVVEKEQTVIMGETQYIYRSPFAAVLPKPVTLSRRYFLRPRTVDRVVCTDC